MATEVLADLVVSPNGSYADATLGGGGHSGLILSQFADCKLFGFDRDPGAIAHASKRLEAFEGRFKAVHGRFSTIGEYFPENSLDGILADLGISSKQVDDESRGFSFRANLPLDLRMNPMDELDASTWLAETPENIIAKALYANSDLDKAHLIAREMQKIIKEQGNLLPNQLIEILHKIFPRKKDDAKSMAIRVIQAIRMEINEEMSEVDELIQAALKVLKPGGRLVFLTYHSVEDRRVKQGMAPLENPDTGSKYAPLRASELPQPQFKKIHRKPLPPSPEEIERNPRARSAKLRSYVRL